MVTVLFEKFNSFNGFYKSIAPVYHLLGISPAHQDHSSSRCTSSALFGGLVILLYWLAVFFSFTRDGLPNNSVSIVSNYIQLLLNAVAFTVALVNPKWKFQDYHDIVVLFNHIDQQLCDMKRLFDYKKQVKVFYAVTMAFLAILVYNHGFNFYVVVTRNKSPIPYWILYSIPMPFYAISLHQAIIFIFCIHKRLQLASELLYPSSGAAKSMSLEHIPDVYPCSCPQYSNTSCAGQCQEVAGKESAAKVFRLINDIYRLCVKVDDYFGPVLLSSLGALFTATTIQTFYCFTIAAEINDTFNRTGWALVCCVNVMTINMSLVVGLSCASELVIKDATGILSFIMREQHKDRVRRYGIMLVVSLNRK